MVFRVKMETMVNVSSIMAEQGHIDMAKIKNILNLWNNNQFFPGIRRSMPRTPH